MRKEITYNQIARWIEGLQAKGRNSFSLPELKTANPSFSDVAIKSGLKRLGDKGTVLSVFKGYYLIIPPQYRSKGILPPALFLDALMDHLNRPYYLALLTAAVYHGASHQQPQEYFVVTTFPVLRPTQKKGLRIHYISIRKLPEGLIEKRKTEAGFLQISNAVLTACDLIQFEKRVGGLSRVATVLMDLMEVIRPADFSDSLLQNTPVTALQRLGYLLEVVCLNRELADSLYDSMTRNRLKFFRIPLKTSRETRHFSSDNRWNVIVNAKPEVDE